MPRQLGFGVGITPRTLTLEFGGASRNRTDVQGFAILCMTTLPSRQTYDAEARLQAYGYHPGTNGYAALPLILPLPSARPLRPATQIVTFSPPHQTPIGRAA